MIRGVVPNSILISGIRSLRSEGRHHPWRYQSLPVIAIRMIMSLCTILLTYRAHLLALFLYSLLLLMIELFDARVAVVEKSIIAESSRIRRPNLTLTIFLLLRFLQLADCSICSSN